MTLNIFLIALIVSAGAYGAIAYWKSSSIKTVKDLFHIDRKEDGAYSLVAANLTLGTGLVYIASLAQKQAVMALLAPFGVLVGYYLLSRIASKISMSVSSSNHNVLDAVKKGLGGMVFFYFISFIIILTYIILIPFEIYVSSNLLASLLPIGLPENMPQIIAYSLFFIVVTYSSIGGLRGVVATDRLQLIIMAIMLFVILIGSFYYGNFSESLSRFRLFPDANFLSVTSLALASFFTAVATQIFSILNLTIGSNYNSEKQAWVYKKAGLMLLFALSVFAFTGIATEGLGSSNFASIDILLKKISDGGTAINLIAIFIIILGMMAIFISTADSGIMSIAQTAYDNLFKLNSFSEEGGKKLLVARIVFIFLLNFVATIPLIIIFKTKPNLIGLLLASISALTVSAPFIASSALNLAKYNSCLLSNIFVSIVVLLIIGSSWVISISAALNGDTQSGNYLIIIGVFFGIIYSFVDSYISAHSSKTAEKIA